jgi:hypothetical protein
VNIASMLVRLQGALGCTDLVEQMVLLPRRGERGSQAALTQSETNQEINLVVGYNSSPRSQTALDLTLWIAHQTRLVTNRQVTVQVVYVVDTTPNAASIKKSGKSASKNYRQQGGRSLATAHAKQSKNTQRSMTVLADPNSVTTSGAGLAEQFEQADSILWQARCLADEWRGSLKTHLRFGSVAEELHHVVQAESAVLLLLGCTSADNPLVRSLGFDFPCPVLGIPTALRED